MMFGMAAPSAACRRIFDRPTTDRGHHTSQATSGSLDHE